MERRAAGSGYGDGIANPTLDNQAAKESVPDNGTTLALLGIALLGLYGVTRLRRTVDA